MLTQGLEQTLDAFMEYLRLEHNASPFTFITYRLIIESYMGNILELATNEWRSSDADRDLVHNWIVQQMDDELSSTTVNKDLSAVRLFYRYLQLRSHVTSNPTRYLKGSKREHMLPSSLTQTQIEETLATIPIETDNFLSVRGRPIMKTIH